MLLNTHRARLAELAIKHRLPWVAQDRDYPEAGALMSYGTDWSDLFRRSASYVDRILKGAKALGLTILPSVLARADQLIRD